MIQFIRSLLRVIKHANFKHSVYKALDRQKTLVVMGNGPSLKVSLNTLERITGIADFLAVNQFSVSDEYLLLKPKYYVILDPGYWEKTNSTDLAEYRKNLIEHLNKKTNWKMSLFVPHRAKFFFEELILNEKITVTGFNDTPLDTPQWLSFLLFRRQISMPHSQNVVVSSLFIGLQLDYKNIFLFGADHTWHTNSELRQDNVLCYKEFHFYDDQYKLVPLTLDSNREQPTKVHEALTVWAKVFAGYWEVNKFAKKLDSKIFNATPTTFVDAFDRLVINEDFLMNLSK